MHCFFRFVLGCSVVLLVGGSGVLASEAEDLFKAGDYKQAAALYEAQLDRMPQNPDVLYNLGTVYAKDEQFGKAVFYYLSALKWRPNDADYRYNLDQVQRRLVDKMEGQQGFVSYVLSWFSFWGWTVLFLVMFSAFTLFSVLVFFGKKSVLLRQLRWVCLGLSLLFSVGVAAKWYDVFHVVRGVVISSRVAVYAGPSDTLSTVFFVHEGTAFRVLKFSDDWAQIRLINGLSGWVNRKEFWTF